MEAPDPANTLTLYVVPHCPYCDAARVVLAELGLTYIERDVTSSYTDLRKMYRLSRQKNVPVLAYRDKFLVRPSSQAVRELLNL